MIKNLSFLEEYDKQQKFTLDHLILNELEYYKDDDLSICDKLEPIRCPHISEMMVANINQRAEEKHSLYLFKGSIKELMIKLKNT